MIKAILHAEGLRINLRYFEYSVGKHADDSGLPYGEGCLLDVMIALEATKDNTWFEYAIATHRSISKVVIELQPAVLGERSRYINMYDCHILNYKTSFSSENSQPLTEIFRISAQGMEQSHSLAVYSTPFRKTFNSNKNEVTSSKEAEKNPQLVKAWWTSDSEGCNTISKAKLGDTVYFHVQTYDIEVGAQINCQLWEYDHFFGIDALNVDENKFPKNEINKKATVQEIEGETIATARLQLQENWATMIANDNGKQLELYCNVSYKHLKKELPASRQNVLYVGFSNRTLFIKTPSANHNLPEFISYSGDPMFLMEFGKGFAKNKAISSGLKALGKGAKKQIKKIAFTKMEKGYMADNFGKVYTGKRRIYEYKKMYGNSGELFENVKRGKNFGYRHAGKPLHTTKGISQYDYFSKNGKRVKLLGLAKNLGSIFDIFSLVNSVGEDLDTSKPLPLDFGPLSPIADLIGVIVQEQKAEMDVWLEETVQMEIDLAKLEGLEATRKAINSWNHNEGYNWQLMSVSSETANKLLAGEFNTFDEFYEFNIDKDLSGNPPQILYREIMNTNRDEYIYVIETIFINE